MLEPDPVAQLLTKQFSLKITSNTEMEKNNLVVATEVYGAPTKNKIIPWPHWLSTIQGHYCSNNNAVMHKAPVHATALVGMGKRKC